MLDEYVKVPLYQYQVDLLTKLAQTKGIILCSTPHTGKTESVSFFASYWKQMAWEIRAKHHNASVKVQFT
jgi:hypothetical protein